MAKGRAKRLMGIAGLAVLLAASAALLWNEWRLARRFGALDAALAAVASGGPAVHLLGEARARTPVRDPLFGLVVDALRLDRTAQTYQWREEKEGSGGDRVVRYERVWSPALIRSDRFVRRTEHVNPPSLPVETASFAVPDAMLAGELLSTEVLAAFPAVQELAPEQSGPVEAEGRRFARQERWLYSGEPAAPRIGDVRVRFDAAPEGLVSVVAARTAGGLVPFVDRHGEAVAVAAYGEHTAEALLQGAAKADWRDAWSFRGFGTLAIFVGVILAGPSLAERSGGAAFRGGQRIVTMALLAVGLAALACAAGWLLARLFPGVTLLAG